MFTKWIYFSLHYRKLMVFIASFLVLYGVHTWFSLPVDAFPDISPTQVKIILKIPGMTPEEVEQRVVRPVEIEMLSIPQKRIIRSVSKYGIADITIDFEDGTDIYWARQQVSERLNSFQKDLPPGASGGLAPITTPLSEVYMFTVDGENYSLMERRSALDWIIRPELRTIPGVAEVNTLGGEAKTYEVIPDSARMAARGVTMTELRQSILTNNSNDGAGRVDSGEEALVIRVEGAVKGIDDIKSMTVSNAHGQTMLLDEIATVRTGALTRNGAVTENGTGEVVEGLVLSLRGANARLLVTEIEEKLNLIQSKLPPGMTTKTFYNRGELVSRAAGTVTKALLEATVLVCITLYLFLGGLRAAFVVAVVLPLSIFSTFILMHYFGLTANLMSLGGLAIAIGMLVDASVVVVENIEKYFSNPELTQAFSKQNVIVMAVSEVIKPVTAGVLIIAVVFLPLLTLEGLEGKLFSPVALTIVMALISSLLIAFSIVPALAFYILKREPEHETKFMRVVATKYRQYRDVVWSNTGLLYKISGVGLCVMVILYMVVGKTFMPTLDEGDVLVQLQKLPSISLENSLTQDTRVEQSILESVSEVKSIVARAGADELGLDPMGLNETDMFLVLKPKEDWSGNKEDIIQKLREVLDGFPGMVYGFTQPIEMRVSEMLTGARGDLAIKIFGPDLGELSRLAGQIQGRLKAVEGTSEAITVANASVDYLQVDVDRTAAGSAGMPVDMLQDMMRANVEGVPAGVVTDGLRRVPILIRGAGQTASDPQAFVDQAYLSPSGQLVRAGDVANVRRVAGPVKLEHENGSRFALVQAFVSGRDLVGYVQDVKADVATHVALPPGYRLVWGGQFENQQRAASRLMIVLPLSVLMIFIVLYATLGSLRAALLILVNIPFAAVGGMVALAVSGEYLSVPAAVGFIALLGIAVLNGLVMVSYFRQLRETGMPLEEAVRLGAARRLRPVLMTASIAAFGLVPLLFATGPGSEIQRPLAIVVTGGLVTATLLTLVLLPILYARFGESADERAHGPQPELQGDAA